MTKVLLLQFDTDPMCGERRQALQKTGATVSEAEPRWPIFFDAVNKNRPDIIAIAASVLPSHPIEAARYLGDGFNTRDIPIFLVDVRPEDVSKAKSSAPRAKLIATESLSKIIGLATATS